MTFLLALGGTVQVLGWGTACAIDVTIARWPKDDAFRELVPPLPVRWLILLVLWPLALRAVLAPRRRTR
jgi:hypothetical protein